MEIIMITKSNGAYDVRPLLNHLSSMSDGIYRLEIKKIRKNRSLDQNGWLFGCIYPLLMNALNAEGWEFVTISQVHEFFKSLMEKERIVNKHTGEIVEIPSSTAEMDTHTFSTYCDKLRDYGREYLGIEIPEPNKLWK